MKLLLLIAVSSLIANLAAAADESSLTRKYLAELNTNFTIEGNKVNPKALNDLLPWQSDSSPGPISIDIGRAQNSNRYYCVLAPDRKDMVLTKEDEFGGYVGYKHLGKLSNGTHVVELWESGGGSGVFMDLLLVHFSITRDFINGEYFSTVSMNRVGHISLGDRYVGEISVNGNKIIVGKRTYSF